MESENKPTNPYRKGTLRWMVMQGSLDAWPDGGWVDLTIEEIAEVLGYGVSSVSSTISRIRRDTGYDIPHIDGRARLHEYECVPKEPWEERYEDQV